MELVSLHSGLRAIIKCRNDRAYCRETLIYRELLNISADGMFPQLLGVGTENGVHILALEYVEGIPLHPANVAEIWTTLHRLESIHKLFAIGELPVRLARELLPDPIENRDLYHSFLSDIDKLRSRSRHFSLDCDRFLFLADDIAALIGADPIVFDPGDIRPENVIVGHDRCVFVDFENAGFRRRCLALAGMVRHWPEAKQALPAYFPASHYQAGLKSVQAAAVWLSARHLASLFAAGMPDVLLKAGVRDAVEALNSFSAP